jgi:hypothetical protein
MLAAEQLRYGYHASIEPAVGRSPIILYEHQSRLTAKIRKGTPLATQPLGLLDSTAKQRSAWPKALPARKALLSSESALQVHSGGPLCDVVMCWNPTTPEQRIQKSQHRAQLRDIKES